MVVGRGNETLKAIRRLRRRQGDHALLEGPHLVAEAVAAGLVLDSVLVTPRFAAGAEGRRLLASLRRPPLEIAEERLAELCDADSPRGVLALARLPRGGSESLPARPAGTLLYLDGIQDPGNLGAIARVAEAFSVAGLALAPGCVHPNHPRALRASAGSLLRVPAAREVEVAALDRRLHGARPLWAGLVAHGGDPPGSGAEPGRALVLALGAEGTGLRPEVASRCEARWTIPLAGRVESLNVAVAAAVTLFTLRGSRSPCLDRPAGSA